MLFRSEINSRVADAAARVAAVRAAFSGRATTDELDGVTFTGDGWWFNLRSSNTEPLLRLNVEASSPQAVKALVDEVLSIVRS